MSRGLIFLSFLVFWGFADLQKKNVPLGSRFSIDIHTYSHGETYILSSFDSSYLSNIATYFSNNTRGFVLKAIRPGKTKLSIDRIYEKKIEKNYLHYEIKIIGKPKVSKLSRLIKQKKIEKKKKSNKEGQDYKLIMSLLTDKEFSQVDRLITDFNRKYPSSKNIFLLKLAQADYLREGEALRAEKLLHRYYDEKKANLTDSQNTKLLLKLIEIKKDLHQTNDVIAYYQRILYLYPTSLKIKQVLFSYSKYLFSIKKYKNSQKYFEEYYRWAKKQKDVLSNEFLEETIWYLGQIYEKSYDLRNVQIAADYYHELIDYHPMSLLKDKATQRLNYINKHFLQPK